MTITRSKPFYAVAGAGDLAVKKLREVPGRLSTVRVDRQDIAHTIAAIQGQAKALPGKAQMVAADLVGDATGRADAVYGELVSRGRSVVTRIRSQKATQDLEAKAGTTVRRSRTTARTAKKAAEDTRSAARGTATTARKRAAATTKAAKSTADAAADTAAAAAKATRDGADKVGS